MCRHAWEQQNLCGPAQHQKKEKRYLCMKATKLKEGIYWVGAVDWNIRNFHGYSTEQGTSYGAYLIVDEKVTLIDTVKAPFAEEMISRISDILPPENIDIIISNHVEMDHSGALPAIRKHCPNASIYTSSPAGAKGLAAHYGDYGYLSVKTGDSLSIGKRTLSFVSTPMLHWPDNMVTYCPEEKILFSNDAFGQHYASTGHFDDEVDLPILLEEAKKYYGNILMCFGRQIQNTGNVLAGMDIDMIAPSHGIIWRSHIEDILKAYHSWSANEPSTGAVVVYDSMWNSTEKIAKTICEAFADKDIPAILYDLKTNHISNIVPEILTSKYIAVGSPTLNNQMMPSVAAFLSYLKGLSPKNREAFAFGSYGWSGQSIELVEKELEACGFHICMDRTRINYIPSQESLREIYNNVQEMSK